MTKNTASGFFSRKLSIKELALKSLWGHGLIKAAFNVIET
jgi:hypothetical protein